MVSAGVRIERGVFDKAEKIRLEELKKGNGAAMSSQSWFSFLVLKALEGL